MHQFSVVDPWHFGTGPDPAIFVLDIQDEDKKTIFFAYRTTFLRYIYIIFLT